ncbi:lipoxygenase family protein [Novosphingobium sp.]|uniref:lipoxygenase family protein n=1 Tax=Novosphingobium sp. TaxID=1874826 RepID=UPI0035B065A6
MPHCAPAKPSLPQNDTAAKKIARALQLDLTRVGYEWTTQVPSLPQVPVVKGLPAAETPTLTWWVLLTEIFVKLVENHLAVQQEAQSRGAVSDSAGIAASAAIAAAISAEVAAIKAKIAHNTSGGTIWSRLAQDVEMELLALGEEGLAARFEDHARKLCAILELGEAKEAALGNAFPRSLETYRELFRDVPLPGIAWCFQDDHEFARLRVAGPNPMLIARVDALPAKLPLTEAHYAAVVNGDTLASAIAEGRLYILDYEALSVLVPGSTDGQAKYVYCPIALFAVPPGGASLVPVAIQCGQDPNENPIFTPTVRADEQWGWEIAKLIVQVADGNYHELFAHLAHTHLVIEAVAVATRRHLAEVHPLWALLVPHFEGTLFINYEAATSLITPNGPIDRIFGGTIASSQQMAADARFAFDFNAKMLPHDLKARGVDDAGMLPDFPYRDDALLVWQAIHEWVQGYVGLYYAADSDVVGDTELAAWAAAIAGEGQVKGFGAITTRAQLVDTATMILFTASAQHAAVNFPQAAIMEFAPAVTGAGWQAAPLERHGHDRQEWLSYMPPSQLALKQLEVLYLLGSLHYRPLGTYLSRDFPYPAWFADPAVTGPEGPLVRFQGALMKVEERIVARNAQRRVAYPFLLPSMVPTSINI